MSEELELKLLQEIEELKKELSKSKKVNKKTSNKKNIPIYSYSNITIEILKSIVTINKKTNNNMFEKWFSYNQELDNNTILFLEKLLQKEGDYIKYYFEEDLKAKFLIPILNNIDFTISNKHIKDFYNNKLTYKTDKFILNGNTDYVISKGEEYSEKPFFFIQEFKRGEEFSNPRPQLLAELISAVELNNWQTIKGAFIVGSIWNFVILEKLEKHNYQYFVSRDFLSSNIEDLKAIYKNLLYIKNEIIEIVNNEIDNE